MQQFSAPAIGLCFLIQIIFVPLFIKFGWPESTKKGFLCKMVCAAAFVAAGVFAIEYSGGFSSYSKLIFEGLILGFVGDFCLTFDPFLKGKPKWALAVFLGIGGIAFFTGHFFYIFAFLSLAEESGKAFIVPLIIGVAALFGLMILIKKLLRVSFKKLTLPIALYAIIILFMFVSAVIASVLSGRNPVFGIMISVGALCFVFSDSLLAIKTFEPDRFNTLGVRSAYIVTYFAAQMLIAASAALI